jgi:hypothetical protein
MRKQSGFNVRVRLSESEGRQIHETALRENRSQSNAISILLSEALAARRAKAANEAELLREGARAKYAALLRGEQPAEAQQ